MFTLTKKDMFYLYTNCVRQKCCQSVKNTHNNYINEKYPCRKNTKFARIKSVLKEKSFLVYVFSRDTYRVTKNPQSIYTIN